MLDRGLKIGLEATGRKAESRLLAPLVIGYRSALLVQFLERLVADVK